MKKNFSICLMSIPRRPNLNLNDLILWFAQSLGLLGIRDKDKSCFRIFIELLKNTDRVEGLSSDELANQLRLTRGTVIHHLVKLESSNIVIKKDNKYRLNSDNLELLIDNLSYDVLFLLKNLKQVAKELDIKLGLTRTK